MPSRRRFLTVCGTGICLTAGCAALNPSPGIPREVQILDERTTIDPGGYQAWELSEPISSTSLPSNEGSYLFSYEFVVEAGPAIVLAVTTSDSLERRAETGHYRVWGGTRTQGTQGATSESLPVELLELLVADNQSPSSETPSSDRDAATVHIQAYISTPEQD